MEMMTEKKRTDRSGTERESLYGDLMQSERFLLTLNQRQQSRKITGIRELCVKIKLRL